MTDRPELANYAQYLAVNGYSVYGLRACLEPQGFVCLDRFDLVHPEGKGLAALLVPSMLRGLPPLRLMGHMLSPLYRAGVEKSSINDSHI
jgi:2-polyprenyl-6-hydroxyphenyl methylase/3-demethylubiquinone-9 3-methyltransferase